MVLKFEREVVFFPPLDFHVYQNMISCHWEALVSVIHVYQLFLGNRKQKS